MHSRISVEKRTSRCTVRGVSSREQHLPDFHLAERCIEHDATALALLQSTYGGPVRAYLVNAGASSDEARETVQCLWGDLLTPTANGRARLLNYDGSCKLLTWLNSVALNALLTRKRVDGRRQRRFPSSEEGGQIETPDDDPPVETPLLELLRDAVQFAFGNCPAEDFVLLQLAHADDLHVMELAKMFGRTKSALSRDMQRAGEGIAGATLQYIKATDPWLQLQWEDFLDLCRSASPACFGVE